MLLPNILKANLILSLRDVLGAVWYSRVNLTTLSRGRPFTTRADRSSTSPYFQLTMFIQATTLTITSEMEMKLRMIIKIFLVWNERNNMPDKIAPIATIKPVSIKAKEVTFIANW